MSHASRRANGPFCSVPRRTLCVKGSSAVMGPGPLAAIWWRRAAGFSVFAGASRWRVRASSRSFSGAVLVAGFPCFARAARFASRFAAFTGFPLAISPRSSGGVRIWAVSVPVLFPRPLPPAPAVPGGIPTWFFRD